MVGRGAAYLMQSSANRRPNKRKAEGFSFCSEEVQPILGKDSAKSRVGKENASGISFLDYRVCRKIIGGVGCRVNRRSTKTPKGLQAPSPGQASAAKRHPGLGRGFDDTPPEGAKAVAGGISLGEFNVRVGGFERFCRCFCPLRGRIGTHLA